jgi:hypothetical protein
MYGDQVAKQKKAVKHTTITIPTTLFELLEDRMAKTGFGSVSAYSTYILRETVTRMMQEDIKANKNKRSTVERLHMLGYV